MVTQSQSQRLKNRLSSVLSPSGSASKNWDDIGYNATRLLAPVIKNFAPDVALVDFGSTGVLAAEALANSDVPFAVHFHGNDITGLLADKNYRRKLNYLFRSAEAVIAASDHIRRLLILEGAPPRKCRIVRLDVNTDACDVVSWEQRKNADPSVVFLGRLTAKKNPVALIEAFAIAKKKIKNASLTIIGEGAERHRVEERIKRRGLENAVRLLGALPREEALPIVAEHWVYAQHSVTAPSGDQEGFALSPAEAALLQLPVASTWHNGIPEHVEHGVTGLLCREFDYETMGQQLIQLLSNPLLCEQMGLAGQKSVAKRFGNGDRAKKLTALLKSICGFKRSVNQD